MAMAICVNAASNTAATTDNSTNSMQTRDDGASISLVITDEQMTAQAANTDESAAAQVAVVNDRLKVAPITSTNESNLKDVYDTDAQTRGSTTPATQSNYAEPNAAVTNPANASFKPKIWCTAVTSSWRKNSH